MHEGKLTSVKTLKRYADVNVTEMRDGYNNVDIPLTFDPLKVSSNSTLNNYVINSFFSTKLITP